MQVSQKIIKLLGLFTLEKLLDIKGHNPSLHRQ